jgi:hypothetical protein
MTCSIAREAEFGVREQVIAEGRAHGTLARERRLAPNIYQQELKMMVGRWRHAGINGNWATAGEQAAHVAYRVKDIIIADPPAPSSPASMQSPR